MAIAKLRVDGRVVIFESESAAISYVNRKQSTCEIRECEDSPIPEGWDRLYDLIYPTCVHGLSAEWCYGPGHYEPDRD